MLRNLVYLLASMAVFSASVGQPHEVPEVQAPQLSDSSHISLITMGPTQKELYSAFGHTAIRVHDPKHAINMAFNYGIFDFNQPNFYLNFAKGKLLYKLGTSPFDRMEQYYIRENRSITEQVLSLDSANKQALFNFLVWNALPQNQSYYYNYIYDNCSTRPRDVIEWAYGEPLSYDSSFMEGEQLTFRQLMDQYLKYQPWGDVGIDLCLGLQIDQVASARQYMFLPDYLMYGLEGALTSDNRPVVEQTRIRYQPSNQEVEETFFTPTLVFFLVLLFAGWITYRDTKKVSISKEFDYFWMVIFGMVGVLLLLLWFGTDHLSKYNMNVLWANPLYLIGVFLLPLSRMKWIPLVFGFIIFINLILLVGWFWWPQQLNTAFIPLVLMIILRSAHALHFYRKSLS